MSEFTVVTSVPRPVLAEAIRYAARGALSTAHQALTLAAGKFVNRTEWTASGQRGAPDPIAVASFLEELTAACAEYRERYAVVAQMVEEAAELAAPDDQGAV